MTSLRDDQVNEIIRCGRDPVYFIKTYTKIQHPTKGIIPFDTYDFQDECVDSFLKHRLNIVLKSRQLGLTTICAAYAVWLAVFRKDKNILVIATKLKTAMTFIKKVKVVLENMPPWLLLPKYDPSKQMISFSNGSIIQAIPTSDDAGRSESLSLLIIDEAAHIRDFDEIWTGLAPTFSTGGNAIVLSTPNGVGGQYYQMWMEAEAGVNGFNPIRIPWYRHPEHDQAWFDNETKNLPKKKISQEYLCVGAGTKIVTPDGYKHVEQLNIGDLVLTHKGRFRPVEKIGSRLVDQDEKLYEVTSPGNRSDSFVITGNHPMLSYRFIANDHRAFDHLLSNPTDPSWITADEINAPRKTNDKILNVLLPQFRCDEITQSTIDLSTLCESIDVTDEHCRYPKQWGQTKRYVNVDFDLGRFVGLYLAEGCSHGGGVDLGFHTNELKTHVAWCQQFLESLGCRVTVAKSSENGCRLWTFNQHVGALMSYFIDDFKALNGRRAPNKTLKFDRVVACGKDFIRGLLQGHHDGDRNHTYDKKTCAYSTSSKLIYQLRTLNTMFGIYPRIGKSEYSKINENHSDMWYLEFQTDGLRYSDLLVTGQQRKSGSRSMFVNGSFVGTHKFNDVSHLSSNDGGFTVYDISVADDRSFVAHSAVLHNCDFISSGDTFLQAEDLERLLAIVRQPISKHGHKNEIWVWVDPVPGKRYVMSADVARGDAHDFSAFHIIDTDLNEVCVEYMGKAPPERLADMMFEWGNKYNTALAMPENNTFGYFVNRKLLSMGYKKMYYHNAKGDPYTYVPPNDEELAGFPTNVKTRAQILSKLEELLRTGALKSYSHRLYEQLQAFLWFGNKPMAAKGAFDDLVMSIAIGSWMLDGGGGTNKDAASTAMAILQATSVNRKMATEMPNEVNTIKPLVSPYVAAANPYLASRPRHASQVRSQDRSDFRWLLG